MTSTTTAALVKTVVTRLLSYVLPTYGADTIQSLTGGRVYVSQAPDDTLFPCAIVRIINRQTAAEYANQRELFDVEVMIYGRPRSSEQVVEAIADLAVQSLVTWVEAPSRTNLALRSSEFDNAAWAKSAASIVANADPAPNGTVTGERMVEDTATGGHSMAQNIVITPNAPVAVSVYAKAGTRGWVSPRITNGSANTIAVQRYFDLVNGVEGAVFVAGGGAFIRSKMEAVGGGWYRCTVVGTIGGGLSTGGVRIYMANANSGGSYTGDGASYLSLWGAQVEDNAQVASPYIPSGAAPGIRNSLTFARVAQRDTLGVAGDPFDRELVAARVVVECASFSEYLVNALQAA